MRDKILPLALALLLIFATVEPAGAAEAADLVNVSRALIVRPRIEYPYAARREKATGAGVIQVHVDRTTGKVTKAYMHQSTGNAALDDAAVTAFLHDARFRPGTVPLVRIPITFSLVGVNGSASYDVKKKSMDDVLAQFLGKGTVLRGPIPEYPRSKDWTFKEGKGVYELHADATGAVRQVKILKSSGDATFDQITERTLRRWRLKRGPLVLELPLHFKLTPVSYSVNVAR